MANPTITPQTIFRLGGEGAVGEVRLSAEAWRVLTQVNSARSVADIAANLNVDPVLVTKTAEELCRLGLLGVENLNAAALQTNMDAAFFQNIEREITRIMGPIGPILIEEEVANLGETRDNFPRALVAALVERVSAQIADEKKRVGFQRIMLEAIQKL